MELLLKIATGLCFAAGFHLVLQRSLLQLVLGFAVLANAANLLIFVAGGLAPGSAPLIPENGTLSAQVDPLPQALILTAIVISFGMIGFILALAYRVHHSLGVLEVEELQATDALETESEQHAEGGR